MTDVNQYRKTPFDKAVLGFRIKYPYEVIVDLTDDLDVDIWPWLLEHVGEGTWMRENLPERFQSVDYVWLNRNFDHLGPHMFRFQDPHLAAMFKLKFCPSKTTHWFEQYLDQIVGTFPYQIAAGYNRSDDDDIWSWLSEHAPLCVFAQSVDTIIHDQADVLYFLDDRLTGNHLEIFCFKDPHTATMFKLKFL